MRRFVFASLIAAACSSGTNNDVDSGTPDSGHQIVDSGTPDAGSMGNLPDGGFSSCGFPGDTGNDAGVGKYCLTTNDCTVAAPICSAFQNSLQPANMASFFCIATCDPCTDPANICGNGATCVCQSKGACGCVPNSCGGQFPDGGTDYQCDGGH